MDSTLYLLHVATVYLFVVALPQAARWIAVTSIVWVPLVLIPMAWRAWLRYVRYKWQTGNKFVVMEIKLPQETIKSPAAMELVLHAFLQTGGEGTPQDRYWKGKSRPWASLELTVINGEVRFFIWCFEGQKTTITAAIYAQYPDIGVYEVEDYTQPVVRNLDKYDIWACQYEFTKSNAYPIKTYVDYGLSEDPDEEFKVDPLAQLIEALGTVNKDDQIWFQFIIRAHAAGKTILNKSLKDPWKEEAKKEIQKIIDEASVPREDGTLVPSQGKMTQEKKELIEILSRSVAKNAFDVGIRCIQMYPKGEQGHIRRDVGAGAFRQFGSNILNNIKPDPSSYDYYWQDPFEFFKLPWGPRSKWLAEHLFRCYVERSFFAYPYVSGGHIPFLPWSVKSHHHEPLVMNTEEVATLYHFPGSAVRTPALRRIPSKRADAPSNLPV